MKKIFYVGLISSLVCLEAYAQDFRIKKIDVDGLQRVEKETVLSYLNITPDSTVTQDELDNSFKSLYNTGLFSDINFDTSKKRRSENRG